MTEWTNDINDLKDLNVKPAMTKRKQLRDSSTALVMTDYAQNDINVQRHCEPAKQSIRKRFNLDCFPNQVEDSSQLALAKSTNLP